MYYCYGRITYTYAAGHTYNALRMFPEEGGALCRSKFPTGLPKLGRY
jgi:hypothetical protein